MEDILSEEKQYYEKHLLPTPQTNCFFEMPIAKQRENENIVCEGSQGEYECKYSLYQIGSNKSPGSDGLTGKFYKNILGQNKNILFEFNKSSLSNRTPYTTSKAKCTHYHT